MEILLLFKTLSVEYVMFGVAMICNGNIGYDDGTLF